VIKQRILGLALSLALLGTLGLSLTAKAADTASQNVTVTATVVDTLTLTLNTNAIDFGSNLNFLGTGAGSGIASCTNTADTTIIGARYAAPAVVATVQSNRAYDIGRGSFSPDLATLAAENRGWIASGSFVDCATSASSGASLAYVMANQYMQQNAPATIGQSYSEFYMLDVLVDSPADTYSAVIIYGVEAL
jgi:hypothetical protein